MAKKQKSKWFLIGLIGVLLAAPNATVIKYTLGNIDPFLFNVMRFSLIALITTPYLLRDIKQFNKKNIRHSVLAGLYMTIAVITYVWAIKLSQASYVSIITLITPIIFIFYSAKLTGERITNRAIAGITLAAIGALIIVALPIALSQNGSFVFYPMATLFILANCFAFPLSIINFKKANEAGLSMPALMSVSSWIVCTANALCLLTLGWSNHAVNTPAILGVLYTGVVVALISRAMNITSYEHIGSPVSSALAYLETLIAIVLPVIVLNEKLSIEMVIGGVFILVGVFIVEYHKTAHHKHHHFFRTH